MWIIHFRMDRMVFVIGDAGERRRLLWNAFLFWPMEGAVIISS
jgi:hypothetical protein